MRDTKTCLLLTKAEFVPHLKIKVYYQHGYGALRWHLIEALENGLLLSANKDCYTYNHLWKHMRFVAKTFGVKYKYVTTATHYQIWFEALDESTRVQSKD